MKRISSFERDNFEQNIFACLLSFRSRNVWTRRLLILLSDFANWFLGLSEFTPKNFQVKNITYLHTELFCGMFEDTL